MDFSQFEEQFIDDEITLNEEEVNAASCVKIQFYIVHQGCLKELFTHMKPTKCPVYHSKSIRMDVEVVGNCVMLKWVSSYLKTKVNHEYLCNFYLSNKLWVSFVKY